MTLDFVDPEQPRKALSEERWFEAFLASKGFTRSTPNTFTNGKATIDVDGNEVCAHQGSGDKSWNAEFPPLLTDADLAVEREEKGCLEKAPTGIANTIKENPDTHYPSAWIAGQRTP